MSENRICSRRECAQPATHALEWSNPKIHTGRKKVWLSCPQHLDYLREYVARRGFPLQVWELKEYDRAH